MKATTLLTFAPLAAGYLPAPADVLLGVLPTAWPAYTLLAAADGTHLAATWVGGVAVIGAWGALVMRTMTGRLRGTGR